MQLQQGNHPNPDQRPTYYADQVGAQIIAGKAAIQRKAGGLYLTPIEVADFMAAQVRAAKSHMRVLDPAAGSGTLLCAVVERLALAGNRLREAELTAYETDPDLHEALLVVLDNLKRWAAKRHIKITAAVEKKTLY